MINVVKKQCEEKNCNTQPSYNFPDKKKAILCSIHKKDGMIDVIHKKCKKRGCNLIPSYNTLGNLFGSFCSKHKQNDMIDVVHKKCNHLGCEIRPSFNFAGEKSGSYCSLHKLNKMINITTKNYLANKKRKVCLEKKCNVRPSFNLPGITFGIYCKKHKLPRMIDVINYKCSEETCDTQCIYGIPGKKPTKCSEHKQIGMLSYPRRKCVNNKCRELALYGYTRQLHFKEHKKDDEYDLVQDECVNCHFIDVLDGKKHCADCGDFKFRRVHLAKQKEIKHFLDVNEMKYESYDKTVDRNCGLERPDFVFDGIGHKVILEVDEHQHRNYTEECEKVRMINISQSLGMPVIFLRYNPDTFNKSQGDTKRYTKLHRKKKLLEWLNYCITLKPECEKDFLRDIYLFYDGYNSSNVTINNILVYS